MNKFKEFPVEKFCEEENIKLSTEIKDLLLNNKK